MSVPAVKQVSCGCPLCGQPVPQRDLLLDPGRCMAARQNAVAVLQSRKFALLEWLALEPGRVVPAAELHEVVRTGLRAFDDMGAQLLKVMISQMRGALEPLGVSIVSQWGTGYYLVLETPAEAAARRPQRAASRPSGYRTVIRAGDHELVAALRARGLPLTAVAEEAGITWRVLSTIVGDLDRRGEVAA